MKTSYFPMVRTIKRAGLGLKKNWVGETKGWEG